MTSRTAWRVATAPFVLTYALGLVVVAIGVLAWGLATEDRGSDVPNAD